MVIDIVLPAVLSLVLVREAGIEAYRASIVCGRAWEEYYVPAWGKVSNQAILIGALDEGHLSLPVTNLKGLVSRSPSDMFAIQFSGTEGVGSCECNCVGQLRKREGWSSQRVARQIALAGTQVQTLRPLRSYPLPLPSAEKIQLIPKPNRSR